MKPFSNPWDTLPDGERAHRTTIDISSRAAAYINGCHERKGTLQTTLNILLERTIEYLKQYYGKLDPQYDPEQYELLVLAAADRIFNRTSGGAAQDPRTQTLDRNDGSGTGSVARESAGDNPQPADTGVRSASKRRRAQK